MAGDWRDALLFTPIGAHNDGTDVSAAATLTAPAGATKLMIQTLVKDIRITFDGTAPTSTKGFQIKADDPPQIFAFRTVPTVKAIQEEATADVQHQWGE